MIHEALLDSRPGDADSLPELWPLLFLTKEERWFLLDRIKEVKFSHQNNDCGGSVRWYEGGWLCMSCDEHANSMLAFNKRVFNY